MNHTHSAATVYSVLLFFHSVEEEHEGGTGIGLFLVVAVGEASFVVGLLTSEDLDFIEFANDELDEVGSTLLESGDSISLALFLKLFLDSLQVSLDVSHEGLLVQVDFLESE